jgi:hypothetical protein
VRYSSLNQISLELHLKSSPLKCHDARLKISAILFNFVELFEGLHIHPHHTVLPLLDALMRMERARI